jgi:antitoxin Phd
MKQQVWQLQEAKNKFSEVVEHAVKHGPQIITRRGVETAIVLSYQEYRRMLLSQNKLSDFFRKSPLNGIKLDLQRDKRGWRNDVEL